MRSELTLRWKMGPEHRSEVAQVQPLRGVLRPAVGEHGLALPNGLQPGLAGALDDLLWDRRHDLLHERELHPGDSIRLEPVQALPVVLLRSGPDRLDGVEIWPVGDVLDERDVHLLAVLLNEAALLAVVGRIVDEKSPGLFRSRVQAS